MKHKSVRKRLPTLFTREDNPKAIKFSKGRSVSYRRTAHEGQSMPTIERPVRMPLKENEHRISRETCKDRKSFVVLPASCRALLATSQLVASVSLRLNMHLRVFLCRHSSAKLHTQQTRPKLNLRISLHTIHAFFHTLKTQSYPYTRPPGTTPQSQTPIHSSQSYHSLPSKSN